MFVVGRPLARARLSFRRSDHSFAQADTPNAEEETADVRAATVV